MALDSAQESRAQKPSDLLHSCGNLSELLTCIFCRLAELHCLISVAFIFLFVSLYILSNNNSKRLIVNAKNDLDFAFRYVSISLHFLFTVEECWNQGMCA